MLADFLRQNFGTIIKRRGTRLKIGIGSAGHGWMRDRHGLGPEAPYPRRAGSCSFGPPPNLKSADFGAAPHSAFVCSVASAELAGRRYLAVKPILFMS